MCETGSSIPQVFRKDIHTHPLTDTPTPAVTSATAIPVEVASTVAPVKAVQPGTCKSAKEVADPAYKDPSVCVNDRVEDLLARMTPVEKIGQMTQVENYSLTPEDVTTYFIGSVLSGGGGSRLRYADVQRWPGHTGG